MSWISTYSGRQFDIFNPQAESVHLEDIAHALSMNCRYNGHVERFYSVAEHSVVASLHCNQDHALAVLMHDAAEAYLTDIPRPIKQRWPSFSAHEMEVLMVILVGLNLPSVGNDGWEEIKAADRRMLATERIQLMPNCTDDWGLDGVEPYSFKTDTGGCFVQLSCWDPDTAKQEFLKRYEQLVGPQAK